MSYEVKRISDVLIEVRMKYKADFRQSFLLLSDVHFDNPKCDRTLFLSHLDQARRRKAGVLSFGDFFCLMQGKYDPRRSKTDVRPEHNAQNYLDLVFSDSADQLADYADLFVLMSDGNHETGILKNLEVNPLNNLCEKLNYKHGGNVHRGGYQGFVRFRFEHESGGRIRTRLLYYHHGKWGGVVSKGTQSSNRFGVMVPQADYVVTGHTHDRWVMENMRYELRENGQLKTVPQYHVKCGTYKQEFEKGGGWAVERIVIPKNLGGWWLEFEFSNNVIQERFVMT